MPAPCPVVWATADDVERCCYNVPGNVNDYALQDALDDASYMLWRWTGMQWSGICGPLTVWPQVEWGTTSNLPRWTWRGTPGLQDWWWGGWGYSGGGAWGAGWGDAWCGCGRVGSPLVRRGSECSCEGVSQIRLGVGTIDSVEEVTVNGVVIPAGPGFGYEVRNNSWLVRLPDEGETERRYWPSRNRVDLTSADEPTFTVTFSYGVAPPDAGMRAAIALGIQLASERCGGECNLPSAVSSFTREGLDVQIQSPVAVESIIKALPMEVQAFVHSVSPHGVRTSPRVFSPDVRQHYSTPTWQAP